MCHLKDAGRTAGHIEGTQYHLNHFIRVLGDVRVTSLTDQDLEAFKKKREKEKTTSGKCVSQGTIKADFKSLKSALNWAVRRKPPLLESVPFAIPGVSAHEHHWLAASGCGVVGLAALVLAD